MSYAGNRATITVHNPTSVQRQEVVSVKMSALHPILGTGHHSPLIVTNSIGQEVDYQVTHDSLLLVDASVMPGGETVFHVEKGVPRAMLSFSSLPQRTEAGGWGVGRVWTSGRLYPDRLDDIAWENDRIAFRVYGPSFYNSGGLGFGPDVWVKNTPEPVIDRRYRMDIDIKPTQQQLLDHGYHPEAARLLQDNSFHVDHSTGNDCYAVGPTLGCGAPCLLLNATSAHIADSTEIIWQGTWSSYEILDNGPLRFTLSLLFPDTIVCGQHVQEHRIYTLDKGSCFNRVEVWYDTADMIDDRQRRIRRTKRATAHDDTRALYVGAGFPLHSPNAHTAVITGSYMQYADPTDNPEANTSQLYVACLFPEGGVTTQTLTPRSYPGTQAVAHAMATRPIAPGDHWTYYAGAAWSKHDVRNQREWQARIDTAIDAYTTPLTVVVSGQ